VTDETAAALEPPRFSVAPSRRFGSAPCARRSRHAAAAATFHTLSPPHGRGYGGPSCQHHQRRAGVSPARPSEARPWWCESRAFRRGRAGGTPALRSRRDLGAGGTPEIRPGHGASFSAT